MARIQLEKLKLPNFLLTISMLIFTMTGTAYAQHHSHANRDVNPNWDLGMAGDNTFKGRNAGISTDYKSYDQLKNIRKLIDKGENERAANRAIKIIQQMERGRKFGDKSVYYGVAYNELCRSATNLRKVEYAMDACNKSLSITPDHWESLKSRATLYFMTQDYSKSLADFKISLDNAPDDNGIATALRQNINVVESKIK